MNSPDEYPSLTADLEMAKELLNPAFERADAVALRFQRRFRAGELTLILGAVVAIALGAIAAANLPGAGQTGEEALNIWALAEAILTSLLGFLTFVVLRLRWHQRWLRQRTIAESLRGEQFLFLGRVGVYADSRDKRRTLEARVLEIEQGGIEIDE
jgi:hypothetical protein